MKKTKQKVKEYARILYHSKKEKYQQNSIMIKKNKKQKTKQRQASRTNAQLLQNLSKEEKGKK